MTFMELGNDRQAKKNAEKRPVLVTNPGSAGALAAIRALGRAGIPVTVAGFGLLNAARWSRFATEYWSCRKGTGEAGFVNILKQWNARSSGHVLFATSDETAWLFARYADQMKERFLVYTPPLKTIETILDKELLGHACKSCNIDTLPTWFVRDDEEAEQISRSLPYPLLIKPRTHVFRTYRDKGVVVESPQDLRRAFSTFVIREGDSTSDCRDLKQSVPMLQQFVVEAVENVISVSGFIDRSGKRSVTRGSRKILQRSRPVGIGVAFESVHVEPELAQAAIALCRRLGYFGVFEIEFVYLAGTWRLIDFNPRFFHQMGLDIRSGVSLPLLAYLDACGDVSDLDHAIAACGEIDRIDLGFSDLFTVTLMMTLRSLISRRAPREVFAWHWEKRGRLVDAALDRQDPLPGLIHALSELSLGFLALPRFVAESKLLMRLKASKP
jgi:D-aspartate ligase